MMKFGTGLSAVLAGVLLWAMMVLAADKAPTKDMAPTIGRPDTGGLSPEAALAVKNFSAGFIRFPAPYDAQVSQITGDNQTTGNKRLLGGSNQIFYLELSNPQEAAQQAADAAQALREAGKLAQATGQQQRQAPPHSACGDACSGRHTDGKAGERDGICADTSCHQATRATRQPGRQPAQRRAIKHRPA